MEATVVEDKIGLDQEVDGGRWDFRTLQARPSALILVVRAVRVVREEGEEVVVEWEGLEAIVATSFWWPPRPSEAGFGSPSS